MFHRDGSQLVKPAVRSLLCEYSSCPWFEDLVDEGPIVSFGLLHLTRGGAHKEVAQNVHSQEDRHTEGSAIPLTTQPIILILYHNIGFDLEARSHTIHCIPTDTTMHAPFPSPSWNLRSRLRAKARDSSAETHVSALFNLIKRVC